jgi:hypothetical protein
MDVRILRSISALSLLFALRLSATIVPSLTFEQMTDQSELVVQGQVTRSWSDWDSEHKYIWTHYEIAVLGTHKGRAAATVVVSEPGGVVGDKAVAIAGVVGYAPGEQIAVFLQRMPNGYLRTTGWGQGKFGVDNTGHLYAAASMRGMEVVEIDQKATAPRGTSLRHLEGISVSELKTRVAARVAVTGGTSK